MPFATLKETITFQNYFFPLGFSGITLIKYKTAGSRSKDCSVILVSAS